MDVSRLGAVKKHTKKRNIIFGKVQIIGKLLRVVSPKFENIDQILTIYL